MTTMTRARLWMALPLTALIALGACGQAGEGETELARAAGEDAPAEAQGEIPEAALEMMRQLAATAEANEAAGAAFLAANAERDEVTVQPSGLQYQVVQAAEGGTPPSPGQWVCVHYEGRLLDGTVFDSSVARGIPAAFPSDRLIRGWVEALSMMRPGDSWQLYIPSDLAYGERGAGADIGPNSTLIFDVSLIGKLAGPVPDGADCSNLVQGAMAAPAPELDLSVDTTPAGGN